MTSRELIKKYLEFFQERGHKVIPSAPLVPENDPSVLFTTAGMHPLVPFLLGETHPAGKRLVDNQPCLRTDDIDEVGDTFHHTFFEMLGNWSLGDYWKRQSISWSWEFLIKVLGLKSEKIWVTCFAGDRDASKDTESSSVWESLGIPREKIIFLPKKDNWWGPVGEVGPCGPDSEIFYDATGRPCGKNCRPGDNCGRFAEIWNNVFMQYHKVSEGKFEPLKQKNVDTGMGVDRTTAVVNGLTDDYRVKDLWGEIILAIEETSGKKYEDKPKAFRIVADHSRAAVFIASEEVYPANKERGYILRRLIRRAVRFGKVLGIEKDFLGAVSRAAILNYATRYPRLAGHREEIMKIIAEEEGRFRSTLARGEREIAKIGLLDGKKAFYLYESFGFPLELTEEIAKEKGQKIDKESFEKEFQKHQELSRTSSVGMFKGGLAEAGGQVTKLHTAIHLLHAALRKVLGEHVSQKGSNITAERLRFDFSHPFRLSEVEVQKVEDLVNEQIGKDLPVTCAVMSLDKAIAAGALHFFAEKYGKEVKVYTIGGPSTRGSTALTTCSGSPFSREICGGPHVRHTGEIGHVRMIKQEKLGTDRIRIYAELG